jgi:peptide/nickel transport system substrate-binding protein
LSKGPRAPYNPYVRARFFFFLWALCLVSPVAAETPPEVAVVAQTAEPQALDPSTVTSLNDFRILANVFEGLVRFDADSLQVRPSLATDWEVSDDGLTYTFHLREDVRFHDGSDFDARAVKFTFDRMLDPAHPYHDTGPFPLAFLFDPIERVEAVDPATVRFHLSEPFAPLLSNLAYPAGYIVSPEAVKARGAAFGRRPSGTGPFRFEMWQSGIKVQLARNSDYWYGAPALEAVVFRPLVNANTRVAELLAGGVDVLTGVPFDMLPILADTPRLEQHREVGPHLWFITLNMREGPFTDPRMRRGSPPSRARASGKRRPADRIRSRSIPHVLTSPRRNVFVFRRAVTLAVDTRVSSVSYSSCWP